MLLECPDAGYSTTCVPGVEVVPLVLLVVLEGLLGPVGGPQQAVVVGVVVTEVV